MKTIYRRLLIALPLGALLTSCSDFLDEQKPQGTLSDIEVTSSDKMDNLVVSAYAVFTSAEDINSSFSLWNFDLEHQRHLDSPVQRAVACQCCHRRE